MPELDILVVEDDRDLREALLETLHGAGYSADGVDNGPAALRRLERHSVRLVLSDVQMSPMDGPTLLVELQARHADLPVVMMTAYGTIEQAVEAMKKGAVDYLVKPFESALLEEVVRKHLPSTEGLFEDAIVEDPRSRALFELACRVAVSDATVMISGESGTGKEVVARTIHRHSPRAEAPFVAINCAAIPESMLEATLFGYEKGAFTGAQTAHPGKFEQAQGGTLLLDEVSEMPLPLQAKLLRVLQEREVERLGGRKVIGLDVRVLATSNRRLRDEVAAGRLREDLYFRLNVFPLQVPALRDRPGDILPLARSLLARHCRGRRATPVLSRGAETRLLAHAWPGNVRELDNVMQRVLVMTNAGRVEAAALVLEDALQSDGNPTPASFEEPSSDLQGARRRSEYGLILDTLRETGGNRRLMARRLGVSERTLRYKLARMRANGINLVESGTACA